MSGKAPPKGPRALLASMPGGGVQASQSQASPPQGPASSRIGATPPTGPRSLMNGQFRGGFGGAIGPKGKPFINGFGHGHPPHQPHSGHGHGHVRAHPLKPPVNGAGPGPSTLKQQQQPTQNGGPGPNTLKQQQQNQQQQEPDSTQNGLIAPGGARAAISISMAPVKIQPKSTPLGPKAQISPPQPVSEPPPPPPPPSGSPPPMPPSGLPPPPASAPPPPPTNAPPPPPLTEASPPPPPPPPSNEPPPPPPPSDKAAPPPPPDQPPPPLPSIFTTTPDPSASAAPAPISIALPTPVRAPAGPPPVQLHVAQNAQSSSSSTPTLPATKTFFQPPPSPPLPGSSSSSSRDRDRDRDRERERERERSDSRAGYSNNRVSSSSSRPRSPTYSSRARSPSQSYTRQRSPSSRRSVSPLPIPVEPPAPPPRPKTPPKWDLPVWPPPRVPSTSTSELSTPEASSSSSSLPIPSTSGSKIPPPQFSYSPSNPRSHRIIFDPALPDGRDPKLETLKIREWKENTWKSYVRGGTNEEVDEGAVISRPREMDYFDLLMFAIRRVKGKEKAMDVEEDVQIEMVVEEGEEEPSDPSSSTPRRPTSAELAYIRSERQKEHRVQGKGKGKESVVRYDGEVLDEGTWTWISEAEFRSSADGDTVGTESTPDKGWWIREHQPVPDDPRKRIPDKERERKVKTQFYELKYEYDPQTSTGPAPPTCVLITNVAPLTSNTSLRQHFNTHGTILSFEPQIDKENGSPLGVLYLRYATHEEAKRCVERENGKKRPFGGSKGAGEGEEICVAFDGEGHKLKAVIKELDERKKEKRRRERGEVSKDKISTTTSSSSSSARQFHPLPLKPGAKPATPGPSVTTTTASGNATPRAPHVSTPVQPAPTSIPPPKLNGIGPASLPAKPVTAPAPAPHALPTTSSTFTAERMSASGSTLAEKSRGIVSEESKPLIGRLPPMLARARNDHRMQEEERKRKIQKELEQKKVEEGGVSVPEKDRERDREKDKENDRGRERRDRDHETLMGAPMSSTRDRRDRGRDSDRYYKRGRRDSRSVSRDRYRARSPRRHGRPHRRWSRSRSFSPLRSRSGTPPPMFMRQQKWDMDHQEVLQELARSNVDYVHIYPTDSSDVEHWAKMVRKEEVENRFRNLEPDKIMKSSKGVFISFRQSAHASRVANVSRIDQPTFAGIQVAVISKPPPGKDEIAAAEKRPGQAEEELIDKAQKMILDELKKQLHKDVLDKVVGVEMRKMIQRENSKGAGMEGGAWSSVALTFAHKSLSGLSFKKQRKAKEVPVAVEVEEEELKEAEAEEEDDRPKKKRKTEKTKTGRKRTAILDEEDELEVESEDETIAPADDVTTKKRSLSVEPESEDEEPVRKKPKTDESQVLKKGAKKKVVEEIDVILPDELFDAPSVDQVRITPSFDSSLSPRSTSPARLTPRLETPPPSPPPDFGVCDDEEDEYFAKLILLGKGLPSTDSDPPPIPHEPSEPSSPALRKHTTGSARTEGFYKITHAEKAAYVSQYQARNTTNVAVKEAAEDTQPQHVTSSRSNRANARRRAQGLEEINQVQRAVALSKGETANELTFKFNQLQTRKKHLRFARSPIHDWGLYAMERISRGEMVIEYVGEVIRAQVADKREKTYERQGIGSSYLFRIDEDLVVDATKKGNLGRLINHSCDPNCTAKIITISGEKKIVIYAKQDIELGDEITYDYHFPFEQDKIPCLCGSAKCRGFLN